MEATKAQGHIATLIRRAQHLHKKIDQQKEYSGMLYDSREFSALRWALDELGAPLDLSDPVARAAEAKQSLPYTREAEDYDVPRAPSARKGKKGRGSRRGWKHNDS